MKINFDVDIDMADRDKFLKLVDVIAVSNVMANLKSTTLVSLIIHFPVEGYSTIDPKEAEELGYFKVDFPITMCMKV